MRPGRDPTPQTYHVVLREAAVDLELLEVAHVHLAVLPKGDGVHNGVAVQLQCEELKLVVRPGRPS